MVSRIAPRVIHGQRSENIVIPNAGQIHAWYAVTSRLEDDVHYLIRHLSSDELNRASSYCRESDRTEFIVRRAALRHILGAYVDAKPQELQFGYGAFGKPALEGTNVPQRLTFNLSHSSDLTIVAVGSNFELGVDVENVRFIPEYERIVEHFFPRGLAPLFRSDSRVAEKIEFFYQCWTRMEAIAKASGFGFSFARTPDARFPPAIRCSLASKTGEPILDSPGWEIIEIRPVDGYIAAIASRCEGSGAIVREWKLP